MIDKSDMMLGNDFGINFINKDFSKNQNVLDLRKNKGNEAEEIEMSEKRKIISKKGENEKDLNFIEDISSKIDKKSISVSVMRGKENSNLKEFYTQSLLNMKIDNKMKLTFETKIAFNPTDLP